MTVTCKVGLVVDGVCGDGLGIARALGEEGWRVYLARKACGPGKAGRPPAGDTARAVCAEGGHGVVLAGDIGDPDQAAAMLGRIEREAGRLDIFADVSGIAGNGRSRALRHAAQIMIWHGRGLIYCDDLPVPPSGYGHPAGEIGMLEGQAFFRLAGLCLEGTGVFACHGVTRLSAAPLWRRKLDGVLLGRRLHALYQNLSASRTLNGVIVPCAAKGA